MIRPRYSLDEALVIAGNIMGWPCGIEACSYECRPERYYEMYDLAFDLAGIERPDSVDYSLAQNVLG